MRTSILLGQSQGEELTAFLAFVAVLGSRVGSDGVNGRTDPGQAFDVGFLFFLFELEKLPKIKVGQRLRGPRPSVNPQYAVFVVGDQKVLPVQSDARRTVAAFPLPDRLGDAIGERWINRGPVERSFLIGLSLASEPERGG